MSITQTFHLNLIPEQGPTVIHCDQYDEGTGRLIIKLFDGDVEYSPSGTATIQGRKPDGKGFEYNATLVGNTVTADLTKQMSAVAGPVRCQVVVKESDDRTGTFVFILQVQKSALPDDTDMSESEYQFIEQALEDTQEYSEDAEAWAVGERGGVPVGPTDPTYHNNSYYWSQQAHSVGDLDDLGDVTITSPTNGQVLKYDSNSGEWINGSGGGGGASSLDDLTDVSVSAPTNGQALLYDSNDSEWKNSAIPTPDIDDLGDVNLSSPTNGQVLKYDSVNQEWINANESGGVGSLDDLTDVSISAPTNGQVLKYDSNSGEWINGTGGGGASNLDDLGDVSISSPTNGQYLKYDSNSGEWVNASGGGGGASALNDLTDVTISSPSAGQALLYDSVSQEWENTALPTTDVDDLGDVNISSLADGQILKYDSVAQEWKNANETVGASDLDDLTDVTISSPTDGQVLTYDSNSGEWINSSGGSSVSDLDDLSDVTISSPTNGQVLKYNSVSQEWENAAESGGSGDYVGLYGTTEIVSGNNLNSLTTVGTYYKTATNFTPSNAPLASSNNKVFILTVRRLSNNENHIIQEVIYSDSAADTIYTRTSTDNGSTWTTWRIIPHYLSELRDYQGSASDGAVLTYNGGFGKWSPNKPHVVTSFEVTLTGWTADTTSQSGTTLYKKQVSLNHVYVTSPSVDVGAGTGYTLPTVAEQEAYNLLQYVTVDDSVPCLYLYASAIPTTAFYIKVEGVD